jgi:spermidine/putrescine transport system permease protein
VSTVATRRGAARVAPAPAVPGGRRRWTRLILPTYTLADDLLPQPAHPGQIVFGFNDIQGRLNLRWQGFTLRWYRELFAIPGLTTALRNSLAIAVMSTIIATVLGTMIGLALGRYHFRGKGGYDLMIFSAISAPELVLGASLLSLFVTIGFIRGFGTILIAHVAFCIPFVAVTVRARVIGLDPSLEAAQDLAPTLDHLPPDHLPLLAPGSWPGRCSPLRPVDRRLRGHQLRQRPGRDLPSGCTGPPGSGAAPGERDGHADLPRRSRHRGGHRGRGPPPAGMTDGRGTGTSKEQAMALRKLQNFIGGEYRDAADGRTSTLVNPSTGEGFAEAPVSGQADVDAAMQAAERGFEQWRDATPSERSRALLKIADALEERAEELVRLESENTGKPFQLTLEEEVPPATDQIASSPAPPGCSGVRRRVHGRSTPR